MDPEDFEPRDLGLLRVANGDVEPANAAKPDGVNCERFQSQVSAVCVGADDLRMASGLPALASVVVREFLLVRGLRRGEIRAGKLMQPLAEVRRALELGSTKVRFT
jgi:hypothetical protein